MLFDVVCLSRLAGGGKGAGMFFMLCVLCRAVASWSAWPRLCDVYARGDNLSGTIEPEASGWIVMSVCVLACVSLCRLFPLTK